MFDKKKLIALDIGNRTIKLVYGTSTSKTITVNEYEILETPAECINDGMITDAEKLSKVILEAFKKNKIIEGSLILNVTGTSVINREIQLPLSTDEELAQILEYEAQQYFPVDLSNYTTDFKVLERIENETGKFCRVLIVAAPNKQLENYVKLANLLKFPLVNINIPANCVLKMQAFQAQYKKIDEDYAIIDIGKETSMVCIFNKNELKFSRIMLNGSSEIDSFIANRFNMDFKKAEAIKHSYKNSVQSLVAATSEPLNEETLNVAIEEALTNIAADINRFFDFFNSRENRNQVQRIYLCGGGSRLKGIFESFSNSFGIPVEPLPLTKGIVYKGRQNKITFQQDYNRLVNAIGSLIV